MKINREKLVTFSQAMTVLLLFALSPQGGKKAALCHLGLWAAQPGQALPNTVTPKCYFYSAQQPPGHFFSLAMPIWSKIFLRAERALHSTPAGCSDQPSHPRNSHRAKVCRLCLSTFLLLTASLSEGPETYDTLLQGHCPAESTEVAFSDARSPHPPHFWGWEGPGCLSSHTWSAPYCQWAAELSVC